MKIVFTGGGTAGHVTPNLALIDKLRQAECHYVGTAGMEQTLTKKAVDEGLHYHVISAHKLKRKLSIQNLLLPFRLCKSVAEAKRVLRQIRPDVVFSKGGYVGLPVTIAARKLKIPTVIHESDMSAGLANRVSAHFADVYLSTFPCDKRAKVTGLIVREEILHGDREKGLRAMGFDGSKPVLLVMGGSLGAKALNEAVANCPRLAERFDIFLITGKNKHMGCDFLKQSEFVSEIWNVFAATDVCLTRGGSNSLAELTLAQVPFVTVPLIKQSRGEQLQNAKWFCERGCGLLVHEENLERELFGAVNAAYDNRAAIQTKQRAQKELYGTDKAVEVILQTAAHHPRRA